MNLFFDTEFTGLRKDTTLISIGIVAENGKKFYAESYDYNKSQCNDWIKENVINHTIIGGDATLAMELEEDSNTTIVFGSKSSVRNGLSDWLQQFSDIQFISDVSHYDFVLLIDIFGDAFDLPDNISPVCYDINQDIARYYNITNREAFNKSREEIISEIYGKPINGEKHNSLYDAEVIKAIYDGILKL